jgi:hypothetical protein
VIVARARENQWARLNVKGLGQIQRNYFVFLLAFLIWIFEYCLNDIQKDLKGYKFWAFTLTCYFLKHFC